MSSFLDSFNLHGKGPCMSKSTDGNRVMEFDAAIVGQNQLKRISWEFITIMITLLLHLGGSIWWASDINSRVKTMEGNRNTSAQGAVRDIQIGMLMKIAEENSRVHESQSQKMDHMLSEISDVGEDVAVLRGKNDVQHHSLP